jgi:hypothetical protein
VLVLFVILFQIGYQEKKMLMLQRESLDSEGAKTI